MRLLLLMLPTVMAVAAMNDDADSDLDDLDEVGWEEAAVFYDEEKGVKAEGEIECTIMVRLGC